MLLKDRYKKMLKGREEDEEDVSSYWMALINGDDTGGRTRSHSVENSL
jgi:hypothetical protein